MADSAQQISEQIQRLVASLVATQPAGAGLWLVGGFRYRLLDRGVRRSIDIDYHWQGDLAAKRGELIAVFQRRLLPDVRRRLGLEGSAAAARGTGHESVAVMTIDLAFRRLGSTLGRIEIPVDILRIECVDPPAARTTDGIVYRTASAREPGAAGPGTLRSGSSAPPPWPRSAELVHVSRARPP
ncbi:MAG: hypothetical protein ACK5SI_02485, partial [Planctomycetia bacterium]